MRILVISDIHQRWVQAQNIIDKVPHDKCILLGDYFDDFNDTPDAAHSTAMWLKNVVLPNPKMIVLVGNHDQYYMFPKIYGYLRGSGYTPQKYDVIRMVLNKNDWDKFKFYHIDAGYLFSHAGLSSHVWQEFLQNEVESTVPKKLTLDYVDKILGDYVKKNLHCTDLFRPAPLFSAGWDRGGANQYGGITWCCWRSFSPIKGINQIVGHTPSAMPRVITQDAKGNISTNIIFDYFDNVKSIENKSKSINFCLDTHTNHYAVIEDGIIEMYDLSHNKVRRNQIT